jgi:hypothetical protein
MHTFRQFLVNETSFKSTPTQLDPSSLPNEKLNEIKKLITKGAKDIQQKWKNGLHLADKAYKVAKVPLPTTDMKGAWKQYEEMITFAVDQLAKTRGIDGEWRSTAAMLPTTDDFIK